MDRKLSFNNSIRMKSAIGNDELYQFHQKEYGLDLPERVVSVFGETTMEATRKMMATTVEEIWNFGDMHIRYGNTGALCEIAKIIEKWTRFDKKMLDAFLEDIDGCDFIPTIKCLFAPLPLPPQVLSPLNYP